MAGSESRATNAICAPSGDHSISDAEDAQLVTTTRSPPRSTGSTQICGGPSSELDEKAKKRPSGDQRGVESEGPAVKGRARP